MAENGYTHFQVNEDRGVLVLTITDDKLRDYDRCNQLGREMEDAYNASQCVHVAIDLRNVEFIASVGYMPLLGLSGDVKRCGGRMAVCNMSELVANVFKTTRTLINPDPHQAPFVGADDLESAIALLTK